MKAMQCSAVTTNHPLHHSSRAVGRVRLYEMLIHVVKWLWPWYLGRSVHDQRFEIDHHMPVKRASKHLELITTTANHNFSHIL